MIKNRLKLMICSTKTSISDKPTQSTNFLLQGRRAHMTGLNELYSPRLFPSSYREGKNRILHKNCHLGTAHQYHTHLFHLTF